MMCCVDSVEARLERQLGGQVLLLAMRPGPGRRNQLVEARVGRRRYVLKLGAETAREAWALSLLPRGLGPALVQAPRPEELPLIMERLPGSPLTARRAPPFLGALARALAALHATRPRRGPALACPSHPPAVWSLSQELARALEERGLVGAEARPVLDQGLAEARAHLGRLDPRRWRRPVRALCHGDLAWHNVLVRGRALWLIDFELAGLSDPAVDLALFLARNPLSAADERRFLEAYRRSTQDGATAQRCLDVLPLVALLSALNGLLTVADNVAGWSPAELERRARRAARALERAFQRLARAGRAPR